MIRDADGLSLERPSSAGRLFAKDVVYDHLPVESYLALGLDVPEPKPADVFHARLAERLGSRLELPLA